MKNASWASTLFTSAGHRGHVYHVNTAAILYQFIKCRIAFTDFRTDVLRIYHAYGFSFEFRSFCPLIHAVRQAVKIYECAICVYEKAFVGRLSALPNDVALASTDNNS